MNLQTSFLTPPFGFSLFYLKGNLAPKGVTTKDIYRGVMPFILIRPRTWITSRFPSFYMECEWKPRM
ncbi:TRAP transporter large permease subunit [Vibrio lentus]|nr:TRAP transporter large permease subunit [Vibrio lentus]